jgi:hypothetical protein
LKASIASQILTATGFAKKRGAIDMIPYLNADENPVVLLHVNDHLQGIIWFGAIIAGVIAFELVYNFKTGTERRVVLMRLLAEFRAYQLRSLRMVHS